MNNKILFLILFSFFIYLKNSFSQNNPLEQKISIQVKNKNIETALNEIAKAGNVSFSYNSDQLPLDSTICLNVSKREIRRVLNTFLSENYLYETSGRHIIILKKRKKQKSTSTILLQGKIKSKNNGHVIIGASIINLSNNTVLLSDNSGNFQLKIKRENFSTTLNIKKHNYKDTIIFLNLNENKEIEVNLCELEVKDMTVSLLSPKEACCSTIEQRPLVKSLIGTEMLTHTDNTGYFREQKFQISVLPFAGTNLKLSGATVNKYSFNLLAGYSKGVSKLEIGGLLNINRDFVKGIQICGFANFTGKNTEGVQIAGEANVNLGSVKGVQIAGFANTVFDSINGLQIAGCVNLLKGKIKGAQIAGFSNITTSEANAIQIAGMANISLKKSKGTQIAGMANVTFGDEAGVQIGGFSNLTKGKSTGTQIGGYVNVVTGDLVGFQLVGMSNICLKNSKGLQIAGFNNLVLKNMKGIQISGFMNITVKEMDGLQIAGVLNIAKNVKGTQVGIFNFADTVSGAALGIISFVKKGLHQFVIEYDEHGFAKISYNCGTPRFYNILGLVYQPFDSKHYYGNIYGIGTTLRKDKRFKINLQLTGTSIVNGKYFDSENSQIVKFATDMNYYFTPHFALFASPSGNLFYFTKKQEEKGNELKKQSSLETEKQEIGKYYYKMWAGITLGAKWRIR